MRVNITMIVDILLISFIAGRFAALFLIYW